MNFFCIYVDVSKQSSLLSPQLCPSGQNKGFAYVLEIPRNHLETFQSIYLHQYRESRLSTCNFPFMKLNSSCNSHDSDIVFSALLGTFKNKKIHCVQEVNDITRTRNFYKWYYELILPLVSITIKHKNLALIMTDRSVTCIFLNI